MKTLITLIALLIAASSLAIAQNDPGPNDKDRTKTYTRKIGSRDTKKLSTGWTSGKGTRNRQTHDYVRHTRSGKTIHVHGYYHRARRR